MSSIEEVTCFFIDYLPPELRVTIYEILLGFEGPLQLQSNFDDCHATDRLRDTSLLRVSRLLYNEALPVFFSLNFIAARRSDFCRRNDASVRLPFKPRLIRNLMVTNLDKSKKCSTLHWTRHSCEECKSQMPCRACEPSPYHFLKDLQLLPQLQNAAVNYGGHMEDVFSFRSKLKEIGRADDLECVRIGNYRLNGDWVGPVRFSLRNVPLAKAWPDFMAVNPNVGNYQSIQKSVPDTLRIRLIQILEKHERRPPKIPQAIASIWPRDLPQDLRIASIVGTSRPTFLRAFNDALEITLNLSDPKWVNRRG